MRRLTATFLAAAFLAGGGAAADVDLPGRLSFGFSAGGCHSANDHTRWSASGAGYCYFGEVAYESTSWLVAPLLQWGYTYASGDVPAWESEGYSAHPTEIKGEGDTFLMGGRVRVPLWQMKLRPYAGGGLAWTNYDRTVLADASVLADNDSFGSGWTALGGVEFFPKPASGFSVVLEYRYAVTKQEWRRPPPLGARGPFELEFDLSEKLLTMGVKVYVL
jgi:opacity protein-like surface antigen